MSPEALTAERIYQRLRADVLGGRHRPGTMLVTNALADEFGSSVTPLRDAMHRLAGERLLDFASGGGFRLPSVDTEGLRDLYSWHGRLMRLALDELDAPIDATAMPVVDADDRSAEAIAAAVGTLFALIAARVASREQRNATVLAGERMFAARLREPLVLPNVAAELAGLRATLMAGSIPAIRRAVAAYHARRLRRVDLIAALLG